MKKKAANRTTLSYGKMPINEAIKLLDEIHAELANTHEIKVSLTVTTRRHAGTDETP